jgi:hypothetical protein
LLGVDPGVDEADEGEPVVLLGDICVLASLDEDDGVLVSEDEEGVLEEGVLVALEL